LHILPGVTVKYAHGESGIVISEGSVIAKGEPARPISFIPASTCLDRTPHSGGLCGDRFLPDSNRVAERDRVQRSVGFQNHPQSNRWS